MIYYSLHGFNVDDRGANTVDRLRKPLEAAGRIVRDIDYPWSGAIRSRYCNESIGMALSSHVDPQSTIIAHSNGALIAYWMAVYGAKFSRVVLLNPALNKNLAIPDTPKVDVYFAPSDPWTGLARFRPFHKWGSQGKVGYQGRDEEGRYSQYDLDDMFGEPVNHSGIFLNSRVGKLAKHIMAGE